PPALSRIVDLSSVNMDVVPLLRPAATSSYDLQFLGPTLQCEVANSLQQKAFDYYVKQAQYDNATSFTTLSTIGSVTNGTLVIPVSFRHSTASQPYGARGPQAILTPL